jgi:hypothetical protein
MGHWVYNINDIDMYVPNYGHLVVIDSRYVDVDPDTTTGPRLYKIVSPTLYDVNDTVNINQAIIDDFKKIFNRADFTNNFNRNYGMATPDNSILDLIDRLRSSTKPNIRDILIECFSEYLHNRVGTLLSKTEKDGLSLTAMPKLTKGKLVVYQSRYDEYTWAIYNRDIDKKKEIIIRDNTGTLIYKTVFSHSLIEHPDSNNINQTSEKNFRLNKDSLIDSYKLE